jgi:hypothetical protein
MPRYYFDITDGDDRFTDDEGTVFADLMLARAEAMRTLAAIVQDELPNGDRRDFKVSIRDEHDRILLTGSLLLRVENSNYREIS